MNIKRIVKSVLLFPLLLIGCSSPELNKDIEKLFVKESGSVVIYYTKPYKDKEYTNTVYPVDTEGFVAALQQVNEEMTILRENS